MMSEPVQSTSIGIFGDSSQSKPIVKIGLVAGWGNFPIRVAESIVANGNEVYCAALKGHADPRLAEICTGYKEFGIGRMGAQVRFFEKQDIVDVTMAGKIFKTLIFQRFHLIKHFPDLTFWKHFWPVYVSRKKDRRDDTLLTIVTQIFAASGMTCQPATDFAPELLVQPGTLTRTAPSQSQREDIAFGWEMAKEMGRLDIGQSIVVKHQAVMAVEAIEGTDACIRRGGELCKSGFTVVKVAKPQQDMRFDVPTIGVGTIETIHAAGGRVLAIEAGKTIVLDEQETIALANKLGVVVIAIESPADLQLRKSA